MDYINNITEAIGHTPLLKLNRIGKDVGANVFVKLEHLNPSGSYKDRDGTCHDRCCRTGGYMERKSASA